MEEGNGGGEEEKKRGRIRRGSMEEGRGVERKNALLYYLLGSLSGL